MRKRIFIALLAALLLAGIGDIAWTIAGFPPVRMVWRYGFDCVQEPTGQEKTIGGIEFVEIGPGCFRMGSHYRCDEGSLLGRVSALVGLSLGTRPSHHDQCPIHWVEFPHGFWIARTEITNAQYEAFDPKHARSESSPGDDDPVAEVSWEDAKKYCAWLSEQPGLSIRLPSESEWECACRAGSDREFCFGDDEERFGEYAWCGENSDRKAHAVGTRLANAWGLHDFHGNVWEWCEDTYYWNYRKTPTDGSAWTDKGLLRLRRGGGFYARAVDCRSAMRNGLHPGYRDRYLGFRVAFSSLDR